MGKRCASVFCQVFLIVATQCWTKTAAQDADEAVCAAGESCGAAPRRPYIWPMARGPIGSHSTSPHKAPTNLSSSLAWSFTPPEGKFALGASNGALLIDDETNIYTEFGGRIFKFTSDGKLPVWSVQIPDGANDVPALLDGAIYTNSGAGYVYAYSMESGHQLWKSDSVCSWKETMPSKCHDSCNCASIGFDIGAVGAHKGVIIVKTTAPHHGGACKVAGLNATNGAHLWDFAPDHMVWNFYPIFDDDGESFLFQDSTGGVYRLGLDGREIWKATNSEGFYETWTDGGLQLGPNGVVYSVKAYGGFNAGPGVVRAYRVADGTFLWESPKMPEAPNSWPVIGRMHKDDPLTVMQPMGQAGGHDGISPIWYKFVPAWVWTTPVFSTIVPTIGVQLTNFVQWLGDDWNQYLLGHPDHLFEIWGFDAETGKFLWKWGNVWKRGVFRSEWERMSATGGQKCIPNPCGNPTMDANGNLYVGVRDGIIYQLERDMSGQGVKVASTYDAEACFSNGGTAIAPGMMAISSCDTLFVFKEEVV